MKHPSLLSVLPLAALLVACFDDGSTSSTGPVATTPPSATTSPWSTSSTTNGVDSSRITYRGVVIDPTKDAGSIICVTYYDTLNSVFRIKNDTLAVSFCARAPGDYRVQILDSSGVNATLATIVSASGTASKPDTLVWKGLMPGNRQHPTLDFTIDAPANLTRYYTFRLRDSTFHPTLLPGTGHIAGLQNLPGLANYDAITVYSSRDASHWKSARSSFVPIAQNGVTRVLALLDYRNMTPYSSSGSYSVSTNTGMIINVSSVLEKDTREIPTDYVIKGTYNTYAISGFKGSGDYLPLTVYASTDSVSWKLYSLNNNPNDNFKLTPFDTTPTWFKTTLQVGTTVLSSNVVKVSLDPVSLSGTRTKDTVALKWSYYYYPDSVQIFSGADCQNLTWKATVISSDPKAKLAQTASTCYQAKIHIKAHTFLDAYTNPPDSSMVLVSKTLLVP